MIDHTLHIDPAAAAPIWRQIEEGVRRLVAAGGLVPGGAVPSVRELARELKVNPATVSKAYQRLTDAGVLEVRRGEGTFDGAAPPAMSEGERRRALFDGAVGYASLALTLGASRHEAVGQLEAAWTSLTDGANLTDPEEDER